MRLGYAYIFYEILNSDERADFMSLYAVLLYEIGILQLYSYKSGK